MRASRRGARDLLSSIRSRGTYCFELAGRVLVGCLMLHNVRSRGGHARERGTGAAGGARHALSWLFLRSKEGRRYCDACILNQAGADLEKVRKQTASLGNEAGFLSLKRGICSRCQASKDHLLMAE